MILEIQSKILGNTLKKESNLNGILRERIGS
jgi:hypothetical protein